MRLVLFIFALSLTTATVATASPLERIGRESKVCLAKKYSADHLRAHPQQTVKSIAIQLFQQPDQKDQTVYLTAQLEVGRERFEAFMICDQRPSGLACAIECDGGGADVVTVGKSQHELQFINRGFLMSGGCGLEEEPGTWLESAPGADDVFQVETALCPAE